MAIDPGTAADDFSVDNVDSETPDDPYAVDMGGVDTSSAIADYAPVYDAAIQRLKDQRSGLSSRERIGALLIGFGQPTRRHRWQDMVANASTSLYQQTLAQKKSDESRRSELEKLANARDIAGIRTKAQIEAARIRAAATSGKGANGTLQVLPPMYQGAQMEAVRKRFDAQGNPVVERVPITGGTPASAPGAPPNFPVKEVTGQELAEKYGIKGRDPTARFQLQTAGAEAGKATPIEEDATAKYGGLTGPSLLEALSPTDRQEVQALYEGRVMAPTAGGRAKEGQRLLALTTAAYPDFDASVGKARFKTRQDFTPGGAVGKSIASFNTVLGHLDSLKKAGEQLHNTAIPLLNSAKNWASSGVGAPDLKRYNTARTAVADEMLRAFRNTGGSLTEVKEWQKQFDAASSPAQLDAVVKQGTELLGSRIGALVDPYNKTMGEQRSFLSFMNPAARKTFMSLNPDYDLNDDDKRYLAQEERARRGGAPPAAASKPTGATPTREAFLAAARAANPGIPDAALNAAYDRKYGKR